jgi:hypothetical protein
MPAWRNLSEPAWGLCQQQISEICREFRQALTPILVVNNSNEPPDRRFNGILLGVAGVLALYLTAITGAPATR